MHLFIEKEMRGGISRYFKVFLKDSKANNKCMLSYNVNDPSKFIMYLDVNDLNGWVMSQYLPYSRFKWLNH